MQARRPGREIHRAILELADRGDGFAVAVVLRAEGSTPGKVGAKVVVSDDGAIWGTLGGGLVEAETQRRAVEAIAAGRPCVFEFNLEGGDIGDQIPICGGAMRILIDPTALKHRAAYEAAVEAEGRRERGVLLGSVRGLDDLDTAELDTAVEFVAEGESWRATGFPGATAIRQTLQLGQARLFVSQSIDRRQRLEVLVEPLIPDPVLLIAGAGHVGQAVAAQAVLVGFEVVVVDDRPDFADRSRFPDGVATRCAAMEEEVARFPLDADTYVVIATRDHGHDALVLASCLKRPAAYLGMIGSRRKVDLIRRGLVESGRFTAEEFARVHAPIGLEIGAVTVPEIAASIVSELIAVRRRGGSSGLSKRVEKQGSPS